MSKMINMKININDFVTKIFTMNNVNIDNISNTFTTTNINDVSNIDNDKLIHPIKLSKEIKELRTNLYNNINTNNNYIDKEFIPLSSVLPSSSLLDVLVIQAPKKLEVHKVKEAKIDFSSVSVEKKEKVKRKRGRKPKNAPVSLINSHITIDTDHFIGSKRPLDDTNSNDDDDDDDDDNHNNTIATTNSNIVQKNSNPPPNMYEIFQFVFDNFYDEIWKIEDNVLRAPYLAIINNHNCLDYGLNAYASVDDACSLPIIKEKLSKKSYLNIEDFSYDFHQMFQNITRYYPENSVVYNMSKDTKAFFEKLNIDALTRFSNT